MFVHYFFNWQIGTKNLTKRKFIVEPSFFTSWTITSVNAHGRTCKKTKVYIYLYISLYENLFENDRVNNISKKGSQQARFTAKKMTKEWSLYVKRLGWVSRPILFNREEHRRPRLCGSLLDFEFIRECMKIKKKTSLKSYFLTKIEIKMTHLVFLFCYLLSLCFKSYFEAVLSTSKILSCSKKLNSRYYGLCNMNGQYFSQ